MGYGVAEELTLSVMTLRNAALTDRIQAAGEAGFQGIGWRLEDFVEAGRAGISEDDVVQLLKTSKVRALEVEFYREWIGRENDAEYQSNEARLLELAGRLGARHINVAVFERVEQEKIVASLAALCERANTHNLIVQLEFMPYEPSVPSLQKAWEIVLATGLSNAGLVIDAWHWSRAGESADSLQGIPPERITSVQLSDDLAVAEPDMADESRHHRCIPGSGALDLPRFLRTLTEHGVTAPLSVEVMSDELDALPPAEAAQMVAVGTRMVLREV